MSAIAVIYNNNNEPILFEHGRNLMKSLSHFPANDVQTLYQDNLFFGCHAQWITPESVGEKLPYYDEERQLVITADAIIDNREELFESLHIPHSKKKTITDSELIILAYDKWGEASPKYLIGDFAFMIWDAKRRTLFGARDFSGMRTLYFFRNFNFFVFCTIIQPFFSLPFIEKKLNEQWMAEYLTIPGMHETMDPTTTAYLNIEQLPPSHTISITDGRLCIKQYTSFSENEKLLLRTNEEYEEAFREVFKKSVKARIRTYRKIGAQLSGGLDSGSVVSFAARELQNENKQLHTFSYIPVSDFDDWTPKNRIADERPFIFSTADHVGNLKERYLNFEGTNPFSEIDDWLKIYEMPYKFFENSFWIKGVYEQANKEDIGIMLNGARGNWTISWGPALDYQALLLRKLNLLKFYRELSLYSKNIGVKKTRILKVVGKKAFPFIYRRLRPNSQKKVPLLINPDFAKRTAVFQRLEEQGVDLTDLRLPNHYEARKEHFEKLTYWNKNGASRTKVSLRYNLWDRDPTNDLRVVRFCLSVPEEQCVQNGIDRSLIRRATKDYLPDKVRLNQRIRGIQGTDGVHRMKPVWRAFINELEQLTTDPIASEILNIKEIKAILNGGKDPTSDYVFNSEFKTLMRSLIVYRFMKEFL